VRRELCATLAFVLAAALAPAQAPRHREGHGRPPRDDVFQMVDAYFVGNLKDRLELTDDQLARLLPRVRGLQSDRRELAQRRFRAMHELRSALRSGTATEAGVQGLLREMKAVEAEEPAALRRHREAIDAVLTPVQQAKYRLLEVEVERRVRQALSRSRGGGRGRPGREERPSGPEEPPEP
jgi:Spy/CpxP family protein refolding chaperone